MSYEEDKFISIPEIVFIIMLSLIVYAGSVCLFFKPIITHFNSPPLAGAFFIILVFNIGWALLIWKSWLIRNKRAKIYLSALVCTLSASIITCFTIAKMLEGAFA